MKIFYRETTIEFNTLNKIFKSLAASNATDVGNVCYHLITIGVLCHELTYLLCIFTDKRLRMIPS